MIIFQALKNMGAFLTLEVLFILYYITFGSAMEVLQTVHGTVGAENYTYYRLSRPGKLYIELESKSGDADLFISSDTMKPTFTHYEIQSRTCGKDFVEIPHTFERPFGIGIYGHFTEGESEYKVVVYLVEESDEMDYEQLTQYYYDYDAANHLFYNFAASDYMFRDVKASPKQKADNTQSDSTSVDMDEDESESSVLWHILLTLLKVVFEVIL